MRWVTIDFNIMAAAAEVADGELIRLFVAPQPGGHWDWRVWRTVNGQFHRFGVASSAPDAVVAAERAAEELSETYPRLSAEVSIASIKASQAGATSALPLPLFSRRIFDKVLTAFHVACDQSDMDVAMALLVIAETLAAHRCVPQDGRRRRVMEQLIAAHERRWHLMNAAGV
jgi:hypothetical protein